MAPRSNVCLVDSETPSTRTADAWLISHEILLLAARGTSRTAYFRDALWLILDLSGESVVELWMREGREHRFFSARRTGGGKFEFDTGLVDEAPDCGPGGSTEGATVHGGLLVVPITDGTTELVGHLRIGDRGDAGPRDVELFEALADALGIGILSRDVQSALRERVKELTCLYGISRIAEEPGRSTEDVLQGIVDLLPPAWQYPGIASARIVVDGKTFATSNLGDIVSKQGSAIVIGKKNRGVVEVIYSAEKPVIDEGPFLEEERSLLDVIANQVALIIERRSAEEQRVRLEEQLRHADRLATLGQLAAGVAHELNEPLGNVLGFAQLASKHGPLDPRVQEDLDKIVNASLFARDVIKKLMLFARQTPPNKSEVDLNKVVSDGLALLGNRCSKQGIDVECSLAPDLPLITADEGQVNQVLVNLVVNAIHAMPGGGSLRIETESIDDSVLLRVGDSGIGMGEDVLEKIFLPFYTTKDVDEGTGLGLAVVNGIVTSHGGFINVESEPGEGSTFEISIPVTGSQTME